MINAIDNMDGCYVVYYTLGLPLDKDKEKSFYQTIILGVTVSERDAWELIGVYHDRFISNRMINKRFEYIDITANSVLYTFDDSSWYEIYLEKSTVYASKETLQNVFDTSKRVYNELHSIG